jgi:hypothetical protein
MPKNNNTKKNNQKGGDGYSVNPVEAIGGMPSYPRYSNNYSPVFEGELLQNGGRSRSRSKSSCGCKNNNNHNDDHNDTHNDDSVFNLIKMQGGNNVKLTQFDAVKEVSQFLAPLSLNSLKKLVTKIFLYDLSLKNQKKSKQLGGYSMELQKIIAPLGKSNLLVIAGLLLLHHFAVEKKQEEKKATIKLLKGGDPFFQSISNIIAPSGINQFGSAILLVLLKQAFGTNILNPQKVNNKNKFKMFQKGGNPLKDLIAPLGTDAFIATGLLVILERMFTSKMNEIKTEDIKKKNLIGGKVSKKYEELLKLVTPLSFNTFATNKFLSIMATKNKNKNT